MANKTMKARMGKKKRSAVVDKAVESAETEAKTLRKRRIRVLSLRYRLAHRKKAKKVEVEVEAAGQPEVPLQVFDFDRIDKRKKRLLREG